MSETEKTREIFRGHLDECLEHFKERHHDRSRDLAAFCDVKSNTVRRWLAGNLPAGDRLIKLQCFLDALGYRIIAWERLPQNIRNFSELIGYGVLSTEQAAKLVGFSNAFDLLRVLREERGQSQERSTRMWRIWKEQREELANRKALMKPSSCQQETLLDLAKSVLACAEEAKRQAEQLVAIIQEASKR